MTMHPAPDVRSERGIALITGLLLLFLASSLLAGFLSAVVSDSKLRYVDRSRTSAFYAAHAGLEKLTSDLGNLFLTDFSPETAEMEDIEGEPPTVDTNGDGLADVEFVASDGLGYNIDWTDADGDGDADTAEGNIPAGPFAGFRGLITSYDLWVTARTPDNAEARMTRSMNTVAIPLFQFGIFSESDLTFSANDTFGFGGRVHTNGNLFLSAASGGTTTLGDKVTVVNEVIRTHLANSRSVSGTHQGTVHVAKAAGSTRILAENEGSIVGYVASAQNEPKWTNLSVGTYNGYIRNGRTGAKRLDLPIVSLGALPMDIIKRPLVGEDPLITGQRLFWLANIRILLSDVAADITDLPTVSNTPPVSLGDNQAAPIAGMVAVTGGVNPHPFAVSPGSAVDVDSEAPANTPSLGGFLKVEYKNASGVWTDVTVQWLNYGYTRRNLDRSQCTAAAWEPDPNAILRFQRIRRTPTGSTGTSTSNTSYCGVTTNSRYDSWPLALYDIREAYNRDNLSTSGSSLYFGGVMHYIDLDVDNLRKWLADLSPYAAGSGDQVINENGFTVYFSDRRGNRNASGDETGDFGWEDFVNPSSSSGTPNNTLNGGEDTNGDGVLQVYGNSPVSPTGSFAGWTAPYSGSTTLRTTLSLEQAKINPAVFFRRALKLTNGGLNRLPPGFSVASENPVYVQGDYNASSAGFAASRPAAVMADAITLLSNSWNDVNSFNDPNDPEARIPTSTWFRFAALSGKGINWTQTATPASFGTDGGVHNFLRLLENWYGTPNLHYKGSLASLYYSRQAVGLFRCCTNVYGIPTRSFSFDTNFTVPALLPPNTPMFRDVNTTAFRLVTQQ